MKRLAIYLFPLIGMFITISSCENHNNTAKEKGYPRITFPVRNFKELGIKGEPYIFLFPNYGKLLVDSSRGSKKGFANLIIPQFNATINLTYKDIKTQKDFELMSEDAHAFAYKHASKADDIQDALFRTSNHVSGLLYQIDGNTASSIQFFCTDSTKHYLRGALYFNAKPNKDSMQPIIEFLRKDIDTLIQTLKWR